MDEESFTDPLTLVEPLLKQIVQQKLPPEVNITSILNFFIRKCCELQNLAGDNACAILPVHAELIKSSIDPLEQIFHVEYNEDTEQWWIYPIRFWRMTEARRKQLREECERRRKEDEENKIAKGTAYHLVYDKCRSKHMTDEEIRKLLEKCEAGEDPAMASVFGITKWCKVAKRTKVDELRDSFFED